MNECDHKPHFNFKTLFSRLPQYECRSCGDKIRMTKIFRTVSRIINGVVLAAVVLVAFNPGGRNENGSVNWVSAAVNIGIIIGIMLLYLLIQILLMRFARFETEPVPDEQEPAGDIVGVPETETPEETQEYSPEQLEIMERYSALEKRAAADAAKDNEIVTAAVDSNGSETDACIHEPSKTWKNYIPSKFDFTCGKCGSPIVFAPAVKKKVNIFLIVVVFLILMPASINMSIEFWKFGLLSLLTLIIATTIQVIFVRRGPFILKDHDHSGKK